MKLNVRFQTAGCTDGLYTVEAKGFLVASLHWGNADGPLENWTALAYIPLDTSGCGCIRLTGGRAIPRMATHVCARVITPDFAACQIITVPIENSDSVPPAPHTVCFGVMSDLHMSSKPGRIRRALRLVRDMDCVLLAGDLSNDASPEQFERLWQCIEEELDGIPVLAVAGNHDYPVNPLPMIPAGIDSYPLLQTRLLLRAASLGMACSEDESGAFCAQLEGVGILGLNVASHWRRFVFHEGRQLDWLREQLQSGGAQRKLILCHAPLLQHNPTRHSDEPPYLSRDRQLQEVIDASQNVCFVSGHTHVSLNDLAGCVDYDADRRNIYLNDSSVTPTTLRSHEPLSDREWVDGAVVRLRVSPTGMEILSQSLSSGMMISRGCYRFPWGTV